MHSDRTDGRWRERLGTLSFEARRSPELRGLASAAGVAALARAAGAPPRQAAGLGLVAGLARRELLAARHEILREVRNSADASALAAWLGDRMPPLGTWGIEPDFGRLIADQLLREPDTVVECGSGTTTLLIAGFLRRNGHGRAFSVEHDAEFAESAERQLRAAGLSDVCTVIRAPLRRQELGGELVSWYDVDRLGELPDAIDLLVVDGPPVTEPWARWPALGVLGDRLRPGATILVDDGRRRAERRTVMRWLGSDRELELFWHDTVKGSWRLVKAGGAAASTGAGRRFRAARRALNPRPAGYGRWPAQR